MATTAVIPTFVADGSLIAGDVHVPTFVADGSLVAAGIVMPPWTVNSYRTLFYVPPYAAGLTYLDFVPAGGVLVGGRADVYGDPYIPDGGVVVGGTAPVVQWIAHTPTGGVVAGGAATVSDVIIQIYNILELDRVPQGGVLAGGVATIAENITFVPTGGARVGGAAIVLDRIAYIPSGGVVAGGSASLVNVFTILPDGGVLAGGAAVLAVVVNQPAAGGVQVGGGAVVADRQAYFAPSGGVEIGGTATSYALHTGEAVTDENPYNDDFHGWAINYETNAPSRYARLPANSFCQFNGITYLANAAGIYAFDADDDAGQPIRAGVLMAQTDFGSENNKRIEGVWAAVNATTPMRLKVITNKARQFYYQVQPSRDGMHASRVKLGQGLEGRFWQIGLFNIEGADFELESLSFTPTILKRHGA